MAAVGAKDAEVGKEAKAVVLAMSRWSHGWAPKEDGPNNNNTVVVAADAAKDEVSDVSEVVVVDKEANVVADIATTKFTNQRHSNKTKTGTAASHAGRTCRSDTTANL